MTRASDEINLVFSHLANTSTRLNKALSARAVIRDTGSDAGRFLWSVLAAGEMDPMSEGRTDDLAQAVSLSEAALRAYDRRTLFW